MDTIFTQNNETPFEECLFDANIFNDCPYEEDLNKKQIFKTPPASFFQQKGRLKIIFINQEHGFIRQKLRIANILELRRQ